MTKLRNFTNLTVLFKLAFLTFLVTSPVRLQANEPENQINFVAIGSVPIAVKTDLPDLSDFTTATSIVLEQIVHSSGESFDAWKEFYFVSATDALLELKFNTEHFHFFNEDQKALVASAKGQSNECFIQEFVFPSGKAVLLGANATPVSDLEKARVCFLLGVILASNTKLSEELLTSNSGFSTTNLFLVLISAEN